MTPFAIEERIFARATDALVGEPVPPTHTAMFLRDFSRRAPTHVAWGLRVVLWLAFVSPLLMLGRARTFLGIDDEARAAIWTRALEHRRYAVRQIALVLKALACMCRFDDDTPLRVP